MSEATLCVIPARGGSKRLPRKNIAEVAGRPIIWYTIRAAKKSHRFRRILVSTEDSEIAHIAASSGATVAKRDARLATDLSTVSDVCIDLLDKEANDGRHYTSLCVLYATAPRRTASDICAVLDLLEAGVCDFSFAATTFDHPVHQALLERPDGLLEMLHPNWMEKPSKEIPRIVVGNGSTYAVNVEAFRRVRTWYGPGMRAHIMPRERSIDVDTREDLEELRYLVEKEGCV